MDLAKTRTSQPIIAIRRRYQCAAGWHIMGNSQYLSPFPYFGGHNGGQAIPLLLTKAMRWLSG